MTSDGLRLQMIVCSATLHAFEVKKLADRLMHFHTWVDLKGQGREPQTLALLGGQRHRTEGENRLLLRWVQI